MKYFFTMRFLLGIFLSGMLMAEVENVIVYTDGSTEVIRLDSIHTDSVYYYDLDTNTEKKTALKKVYFIYSEFQKVFYYSPYIYSRMDFLEGQGGLIITTGGDSLYYDQIKFDRHMRNPTVYLNPESDFFNKLNFLDIHSMQADKTVMEIAVRKGFFTSLGLFLSSTAFEILIDYKKEFKGKLLSSESVSAFTDEIWDETNDLLPGITTAGLDNTGRTYQSLTFFLPLTTMGWMVYDVYFDKRSQYFLPLSREEKFPSDMYVFSVKKWISGKINNMRQAVLPSKKQTATPIDTEEQD